MNNLSDEKSQNISSNSSNSEKVIKRRNRPDKKTKYASERQNLIEKLNKLIGLSDTNNSVFLYELERNEELKKEIEKLISDIKKYFKYGNWGYFSNDPSKCHENHITLIRAIYNDCNYDVISKLKTHTFDNIKKQYTIMLFYKK
jgi:hypothetical protein